MALGRTTFLVAVLTLLQGCYTLSTVQYPAYGSAKVPSQPATIVQSTAFVRTVDGQDVSPSFWNKMGRNLAPLFTLGRIENQVLVTPGAHTLNVGYHDSDSSTVSYGSYKETTTTTYTMNGIMECQLKGGTRYLFESDWDNSQIALKPEGTSTKICKAHQ